MVMTTEVLRNMLYENSATLDGLELRRHGRGALPPGPVPGRRSGRRSSSTSRCRSPSSACRRPCRTPRSSASGSARCAGPTRVVIEERRPVPLENLYMVGDELHAMHVDAGGRPRARTRTWSRSTSASCGVQTYRRRADGALQRHESAPPAGGPSPLLRAPAGGGGRAPRRGGDAAGHLLRLQPGGLRPRACDYAAWSPGIRLTDARRGGPDPRARPTSGRRGWPRTTSYALGYLRAARGAGGRASPPTTPGCSRCSRRPSRSCSQAGLVEGGLRHRDALAGHQHAGQDRRHRGPVEVLRRAPRAAHAGRVHAADRAGGPARHRRDRRTRWCCTSGRSRSSGWPGWPRRGRTSCGSSFRPSYNMAVNLVRNYSREEAHHLLNSSFAQFLADRGVVTLERQLRAGHGASSTATASRCAATGATSPSTGRSGSALRGSGRRPSGPGRRPGPTGRRTRSPPSGRAT